MLMLANRMHLASGRMRKSLHVRLETESSRIRLTEAEELASGMKAPLLPPMKALS